MTRQKTNDMELTEKELEVIKTSVVRDYIKSVLLRFHENIMDEKGFDFFFVLSDDLTKLTAKGRIGRILSRLRK